MTGSAAAVFSAVAVIDARPLIQMMQGVELVPIAVMCFPCLAAIDPDDAGREVLPMAVMCFSCLAAIV